MQGHLNTYEAEPQVQKDQCVYDTWSPTPIISDDSCAVSMTSTMLFSGTTVKGVQASKSVKSFTPISNKYKIQKAGSYQSLRHDGQGVPLLYLVYSLWEAVLKNFLPRVPSFSTFSLTLEHPALLTVFTCLSFPCLWSLLMPFVTSTDNTKKYNSFFPYLHNFVVKRVVFEIKLDLYTVMSDTLVHQ